jgi:hypothetical protein
VIQVPQLPPGQIQETQQEPTLEDQNVNVIQPSSHPITPESTAVIPQVAAQPNDTIPSPTVALPKTNTVIIDTQIDQATNTSSPTQQTTVIPTPTVHLPESNPKVDAQPTPTLANVQSTPTLANVQPSQSSKKPSSQIENKSQ